jgi:LPXTG-motif cell wall-anchored protein
MLDFLQNTWVMVGMGVVLLALIGLLIFLRNRPQDE